MIASKSRFLLPGMLAVRLVAAVGPNERVRSSASRRLAGQMESIAQGVAQRAIELVIEALDVNALLARVDLNAMLVRVELNGLLGRVDLNQVLDRVAALLDARKDRLGEHAAEHALPWPSTR